MEKVKISEIIFNKISEVNKLNLVTNLLTHQLSKNENVL